MNFILALVTMIGLYRSFAFSTPSEGWTKITIPGAKCGRGGDYTVFYKKHAAEKLLIEFMGGGACWNKQSCVTLPLTWVYPMVEMKSYSVLTSEKSELNPFKEHSNLYLPFCTGDVFTGDRISKYDNIEIFHYGYRNVVLTLKYLKDKQIIDFEKLNDVIVWGSSAGGIGALTHAKNIEAYLPSHAKKTLVADSPGLHFGKKFWDKFDKDAQNDFKSAFNRVKLDVDFKDGFVARKMGPVFNYYSNWKLGFLYSYRDFTMSLIFGQISQKEHQKLILGPEGIPAIAKNFPNVNVWLSDSSEHRFLLSKSPAQMKSPEGIRAIDFTEDLYLR